MKTLEFNNQPTKVITEQEAVEFMKTLNMNWWGFNNFTSSDQENISDKTDVMFEPQDNGTFKLHDLTFDFED